MIEAQHTSTILTKTLSPTIEMNSFLSNMNFLNLKYFLIFLSCLLSSVNAEYIEIDTDGDGVPDQFGEDYDGDGIIDDFGLGQDLDGDGIPDEGGFYDYIEIYDFDGDGNYEIWGEDHDFDQQIDYVHYLSTDFLHLLSLEVSPNSTSGSINVQTYEAPTGSFETYENGNSSLSELYQRASHVIIPNQEVKLTAQPKTGYSFSHWVTSDEIEVSDASNPILIYQSIAYKHVDIQAVFTKDLPSYAITQSVAPQGGGTVEGVGNFEQGTVISLQAYPNQGYRFKSWEQDSLGTSNPASLTVTKDMEVRAIFELDLSEDEEVVVNFFHGFAHTGELAAEEFLLSDSTTMKWNNDYQGTDFFVPSEQGFFYNSDSSINWEDEWGVSKHTYKYSFNGPIKNGKFRVGFQSYPGGFHVGMGGAGSVWLSSDGNDWSKIFEYTTTESSWGYGHSYYGIHENTLPEKYLNEETLFVQIRMITDTWSGAEFADEPYIRFGAAEENVPYVYYLDANYTTSNQENEIYKVAVETIESGTFSGAGNYNHDSEVILQATPAIGYKFQEWQADIQSISNPLTFKISSDQSLTAVFTKDLSDDDQDGLSNHDELIIHSTSIDDNDTDNDGLSDGLEIYLGSSPIQSDKAIVDYFLNQNLPKEEKSYEQGVADGRMEAISEIVKVMDKVIENLPIETNLDLSSLNLDDFLDDSGQLEFSLIENEINQFIFNESIDLIPHTTNWYYTPEAGWLWTNKDSFPYIYRSAESDWIYFRSISGNPSFYNFETDKWFQF